MPVQNKPIIHGRDHCHDGADPIPCLGSPLAGDFEGTVLATSDLIGYWRLGEAAEPFADTSGYGPTFAENPADLTIAEAPGGAAGTPPTEDVTGALSFDDDGAVEFNYDGTDAQGGQWLQMDTGDVPIGRFQLEDMTVAAWVKVKASAVTHRGLIVGNSASGGSGYLGWGLQVTYPGREIRFTRGYGTVTEYYAETPGGVTADTWYFVTGTYDGATLRLYMDGELVDDTADAHGVAGGEAPLRIGHQTIYSSVQAWLYGMVDEAAVWNRALTADEIAALYTAGIGADAPAGSRVLLSDGEGGSYWGKAPPAALEPSGTDGQVLKTEGGTVVWGTDTGGAGATDSQVWMPLTTVTGGVPELVWDGSDDLIPTLVAM